MRRTLPAVLLSVLLTTACGSDSPEAREPSEPASSTTADAPAADAASFRAFAEGGEAPRFDDQVEVLVDGKVALTLTRDQARDAAAWTTEDGSLLDLASIGRVRFPATCDVLPSPAIPVTHHEVDVRGVSVLWQPYDCDFAVLLVIDEQGGIAVVAF